MVRRLPFATTLLLVLSVILNVALAHKVTNLRGVINALKSENRLKVGQRLPDITARDLAGRPMLLRYSDSKVPTLLYVFTPACSWCYRNLDNIRAVEGGSNGKYRLVGLSLSAKALGAYITEHRLGFPIYTVTEDVVSTYKLGGTPQTLLISSAGTLIRNWTGAYQGPLQSEIQRELGIPLPGLRPLQTRHPARS
jgi:peroxiredoxin